MSMNRLILSLLISGLASISLAQAPIENYEYTFKISGVPDSIDSVAYLANYYGSKQYYFDTAVFEQDGMLKFTGEKIKGGIYSVILSNRSSFFEFVVHTDKLNMETKYSDLVGGMKIQSETEENTKFYTYLGFIEGKSKSIVDLRKKLEKANDEEKEAVQEQMRELDLEVIAYKKQFMEENPDLFITKVFKASAEPEIGDYEEIADETERKKKRYREFKNHYLDGIDFTDERLLRTPVLHNKYKYYMNKLVPQIPDSVIKEADMMIARAKGNKEVYKYLVHTITSKYEKSEVMGMEAVVVHMGQNYYCGEDDAWWLEDKKKEEFCERVTAMAPLQIGKTAPNLILMDTTETKWHNLHHLPSKFTVLYFWDSGCGHCKKVTPKLKEFYETYHEKGVEVYAVGTEFENKEWRKYIKKNELPWINVSDSPEANKNAQELMLKGTTTAQSLNFRDTYDIFSTPKIYLLDENKKIIAVKLMPEQMGGFIDHLLEEEAGG